MQVGGINTDIAVGVLRSEQPFNASAGFFHENGMIQQQGGSNHAIQPVGLGFAIPP